MPELEYTGEPKALIAGCGRVGKLSAEVFTRYKNPWTVVERALHLIAVEEMGRLWRRLRRRLPLRITSILRLVVTMDSAEATEAVMVCAVELRPDRRYR